MVYLNYERPDIQTRKQDSLANILARYSTVGEMDDFTARTDPEFNYLKQAEQYAYRINQVRQKAAMERLRNQQILMQNQINKSYNRMPVIPNINLIGSMAGGGGRGRAAGQGIFRNFPNASKELIALVRAISGQESGGSYGVVNPDSGAMGRYQIMPGNLGGSGSGWDYEALGRDISPQQFLASPSLQDQIAIHKIRQYYRGHGVRGAASAWYSGDPNAWRTSTHSQGGYPSIRDYVLQILARMGRR